MIKNLTFPPFPLIYIYIEFDYNQASTIHELVELWFKWENVINYTDNPVKKEAFQKASNSLYSELTNQSFKTKKFKTNIMEDTAVKKGHNLRLLEIRKELKFIGVRLPMYHFAIKYPEYMWVERKDTKWNRIDNLWHGKIIDKDFLLKMEAFLKYKKVEFED